MAFDYLQDKFTSIVRKLEGKAQLSERNMEETLEDIRVALLDSDVNYYVVNDFLNSVKNKAIGKNVINSIEPGQLLIKIVHDELISLLGDDNNELILNPEGLSKIMLVGLQGTGKTTQASKIAHFLTKQNKKVLLIGADTIRLAANEQLQTLANQINVEFYTLYNVDAKSIVESGIRYAKDNGFDVAIIDTAGRLQIDETLMNELKQIKDSIKPEEILLTVDALTGQDIVNVAKSFNDLLNITGLLVTKFDGDSKGGGALSVKAISNVPIKFVGVGEKIEDLEKFYPDRLADRILGMGDVVSFVEKAQEKIDAKAAEDAASRMLSGKFTMDDLLVCLEQTSKLGPLSSLMNMIPGMSDMSKMINDNDASNTMKKTKAIIQSMTPSERQDPSIMRSSHKKRIASGSGTSVDDVNKLVNQYERIKKLFKNLPNMKGLFKI